MAAPNGPETAPNLAGRTIGPYQLVSLEGAGGMGEVYKARDTRLGRTVAIKVLPAHGARDPQARERLEREARAVAALTHPHICTLHDIGQQDGVDFLVMEYLEGDTLTARLAKGPLPVAQAIQYAVQIASALDTAHRAGLVHRDLKPGNIMLTAAGAKLLDFGLAKSFVSIAAADATAGPTQPAPPNLTTPGTILGTVQYMAPEQVEGKATDGRTDIFAFGAVLFEMLTGKKAFEGSSPASLIAAILERVPAPVSSLQPLVPPSIDRVVQACLAKDPDERWQSARDLMRELKWSAAGDITTPASTAGTIRVRRRELIAWTAVAVAILVAAVLGLGALRRTRPALPVTRFTVTVGEGQRFRMIDPQLATLSPDGTLLVYAATDQLFVHTMSDRDARPIQGTEGHQPLNPVFSPDNTSIVFYSRSRRALEKVAVTGGAPVTICSTDIVPMGISWGDAGIVFGQGSNGIMRVSPNGGAPEALLAVRAGEVAHGPQLLPGGDLVLFTVATAPSVGGWDTAQIVVQSLKSGHRTTLVSGGSDARYVPTGHIVYAVGGVLYGVPFDVRRLAVTSGPVPLVEGVRRPESVTSGGADFTVSDAGSLAYVPGPATAATGPTSRLQMATLDRNGTIQPIGLPPGPYEHPRVSPDGKRLTFSSDDGKDAIVWIYDLAGTTSVRRFTHAGRNRFPVWSADGERVVFQSNREGDLAIFQQRADGTGSAERLTRPERGTEHVPESSSPDGKHLLVAVVKGARHSLADVALDRRTVTPFGAVESSAYASSTFSPDGRWIAYTANIPGTDDFDVFVQPFPSTGSTYQIAFGAHPMWSPDGAHLFWLRPGQYASVSISTAPAFTFGTPMPAPWPFVGHGPGTERNVDITSDGVRFIGLIDTTQKSPLAAYTAYTDAGASAASQIHIVLNWFEELKRLVPAK